LRRVLTLGQQVWMVVVVVVVHFGWVWAGLRFVQDLKG